MMPLMVTVLDVVTAPTAALVCAVKLNGLGVVIAASVVTLKLVATVPTVIVTLVMVLKLDDVVSRTVKVSPLFKAPTALLKLPPLTLNSPPLMLTGTVVLIPAMATVFDCTDVDIPALVWAIKLNASGVVSAAMVVTSKLTEKVPTVTTAEVVVLNCAEANCCSVNVSPFFNVPAALVNGPPLMLYWPPLIITGTFALMPAMVTLLETAWVDGAAFATGINANASGVRSAAMVVTSKFAENEPIMMVVVVLVLNEDDAV